MFEKIVEVLRFCKSFLVRVFWSEVWADLSPPLAIELCLQARSNDRRADCLSKYRSLLHRFAEYDESESDFLSSVGIGKISSDSQKIIANSAALTILRMAY